VMGRIDHQVKLRGFRIELGEIEAVLTSKGSLGAAAVILREDIPGSARLVAYYVQKPDEPRTPETLRAVLAEEMPEYMIPSSWVALDALPLSPNGKLDRAALPLPDATQTVKEEFVAPATPTEIALTKIFGEVLNLEKVGATSDLLKMGADSIQLFQITARANRAGLKITARQLLQHRNAAAIAAAADLGGEKSAVVETNSSLPSLGQFKRSRRTG
jgi:aryl carrier-like protein